MNVKLFAKGGGLVNEVTIPPFKIMPEVICWGTRFFVKAADGDDYWEGMVYFCPEYIPASTEPSRSETDG